MTQTETIQTTSPESEYQTAEQIAEELAQEESNDGRPEWLPEKFWDAENGQIRSEDLAKSYAELEKVKSSQQESPSGEPDGLSISKADAEEAAEKAGLDFDSLASKYAEKGELSDEDYASLEKAGINRDTVDNYIRGQQALAEQFTQQMYNEFGGEQAYQQMVKWAADNLSETQIDAFNEAVETGDPERAKLAIAGLRAQYSDVNGSDPSRQVDGNPAQKDGATYGDEGEYVKDMEDPRYWDDPRYRAQVDAKFVRTWGS